jgi:uncharacterized protein (TIGR02266 family)
MNHKILVVDDAVMFLEIQKMYLETSPVTVCTAMDGLQALTVVQQENPDLIVLDLNMPRMGGVECCQILKRHELYRHIPIVMVTLSSHEEDLELCRRAGCDDLLQKPLQVGTYLTTIHKYIPSVERRRKRVELQTPVAIGSRGRTFTGRIRNISIGGVFIETDETFNAGEVLELSFDITSASRATFQAKGTVVHVQPASEAGTSPGAGISFTGTFDDEPRQVLRDFIRQG